MHTQFHWSSVPPIFSRHEGLWFNPRGVLKWNRESPVSVALLHWWPRRDWSLWPHLRWALSRTVTRLTCRQCDNPTWSHTALLSRIHAHCRSSFELLNRHSRLLGGSHMESLQSHCIHTQFHWSSGPPVCSHHEGPGFNPQGGTYVKPGFSCWCFSRYSFIIRQWYRFRQTAWNAIELGMVYN